MAETDKSETTLEGRLASWVLAAPLSLGLGLIALIQFGSWLPSYLSWPFWADHDVFASAARAWDLGEQPYRDVRLNNFPGTIYLFYLVGKAVGWGRTWGFYALDSAFVVTLVVALIAWSRRIFGRALPGLVGSLAFLSYYFGLDYCHVAQRDWQGPCLSIVALLVAQAWPGRATRVTSALLAALALSIRPQTVLFLPALLLVVSGAGEDDPSRSWGRTLRRASAWMAAYALFAGLIFLPLAINGVFGDFLESLRHVAYGSAYNRVGPASIARNWLLQTASYRWLVVPLAILLLGPRVPGRERQATWPWLVALAGVSLYKPLSPMEHSYLDIPLLVTWSVNLAALAGLIVSTPDASSPLKLAALLGLLGMGTSTARPEFCVAGPNLRAIRALRSGVESEVAPRGYRRGTVPSSAYYPWPDYRGVLLYLRSHTTPQTRIANALKGCPAITSEVDRPSAFPAEAIAWLMMVNPRDEAAFVESLERSTDSVAVWSPGEVGPTPSFRCDRIDAAIRRLYTFEARFGAIEVWRRRADAGGHHDLGPASTSTMTRRIRPPIARSRGLAIRR